MNRYEQLRDVVAMTADNTTKAKPFRILEIGGYRGERARLMIAEATKRGRPEIHYFGFDLFEEWEPKVNAIEGGKTKPPFSVAEFEKVLRSGTKVKVVNLFRGNTRQTLPDNVPGLPPMDIIFIDGGLSIDTIRNDVMQSLQVLAPKGVMILDDYYPGNMGFGCAKMTEELRQMFGGASIEVLPTKDVIEGITVQFVRVNRRAFSPSSKAVKPNDAPIPTPAYRVISKENLGPPEVGPASGFPARVHHPDVQPVPVREAGGEVGPEGPAGEGVPDRRREPGVGPEEMVRLPVEPLDDLPVPEEQPEPDPVVEPGPGHGEERGDSDLDRDEQRRPVSGELDPVDAAPAGGESEVVPGPADECAGTVQAPERGSLPGADSTDPRSDNYRVDPDSTDLDPTGATSEGSP